MSKYNIGEYIDYQNNEMEFEIFVYEEKEYKALCKTISKNEAEKVIELLRQKDQRIAELEEKVDYLIRDLNDEKFSRAGESEEWNANKNNLAIEKLGKLKHSHWNVKIINSGKPAIFISTLNEKIDSMIAELRGENVCKKTNA